MKLNANVMKRYHMYFLIEMTESHLNLALFGLWNDHTPSEAWLSDGKDVMCLHYCLRIVTPPLSVQILNSKWSKNLSSGGELVHLDGCPRGARRHMFVSTILEWEPPISKHTSRGFWVESSSQLRNWVGSCSIGDESYGGSCPIFDHYSTNHGYVNVNLLLYFTYLLIVPWNS